MDGEWRRAKILSSFEETDEQGNYNRDHSATFQCLKNTITNY